MQLSSSSTNSSLVLFRRARLCSCSRKEYHGTGQPASDHRPPRQALCYHLRQVDSANRRIVRILVSLTFAMVNMRGSGSARASTWPQCTTVTIGDGTAARSGSTSRPRLSRATRRRSTQPRSFSRASSSKTRASCASTFGSTSYNSPGLHASCLPAYALHDIAPLRRQS